MSPLELTMMLGNEIDEASVPLTDVLEQRSHDLESLTEKAKRLLRTSEDIVQTLEATVQTLEAIVRPLEAVVQERRGSRSPKTSKERRLSRGSVGKEHVEDPSVQVTQNATSGEYSECSRSAGEKHFQIRRLSRVIKAFDQN